MRFNQTIISVFKVALLLFVSLSSCKIYKFHDVSIPIDVKTVKVNYIENKAPYVNPQLSPQLTDKLRQKIVSQTRLTQTNADNVDWEISGFVNNYSFSTSAISGQREANNRLTVGVHIILNDHKLDKVSEFDISRNFEFPSSQSLEQAEASLGDEMIRSLTDDIFNHIFSQW
ncbi:MAG TPA: LPS assembly lipoprotein LptE [Chitinophagaceae bacterium]|nr:LPS assembly lipoprotein LptE [Chitinophagaceae bacterium]